MFGIGVPELILILALALIFIGPKKLPDLAKSLGRALNEFKRASSDLKESMNLDNELAKVKTSFKNLSQTGSAAAEMSTATSGVPDGQPPPQSQPGAAPASESVPTSQSPKKQEAEHVERG